MLNVKELLKKLLGCAYVSGSSGNWSWKKYADGSYDAWHRSLAGSTGTLTAASNTAVAYSAAWTDTLPAEIGSIGIIHTDATASQPSYIMGISRVSFTANSVTHRYLRFGSTAAVSGISYTLHVRGVWK